MGQIGRSSDLERDLTLTATEHDRLLAVLDRFTEAEQLDLSEPSTLPGWSRGHVITHLADNAIGHIRIFDAAAEGRVGEQYPGGREARAAGIEAGSSLPATEQLDRLRRSIRDLEGRWDSSAWEGHGIGITETLPIRDLPFLRLREVDIHLIDLDVGIGFADLPPEYLRLELGRMTMLWQARQPMGMTQLPQLALDATPEVRLAWLMGRCEIDELEPALSY